MANRSNALALLIDDVTYGGWEHEVAIRRAFYVRGFSWFRDMVLNGRMNVTECDRYVGPMADLLSTQADWLSLPFTWDTPDGPDFSPRQFIDAASIKRKPPPQFYKAAEIILMCEVITDDLRGKYQTVPEPDEVYERMGIEPALSYIHGFSRAIFEALPTPDKDRLRLWTGQRSNTVFFDMADGHTVTHELATRTREFLVERVPGIELGDVDFRLSGYWNKSPSKEEYVDVRASDYPANFDLKDKGAV